MKNKKYQIFDIQAHHYFLNRCKSILRTSRKLFQYETLTVFALILTLSLESVALAPSCASLFDRPVPAPLDTSKSDEIELFRTAMEKYKANSTVLAKIAAMLPAERQQYLNHLIIATEFYDYSHFSDKLLNNFLEDKNQKVDFTNLYGEEGFLNDKSKPFVGFANAREFLSTYNKEISLDLIKEIHRLAMADHVEGVNEANLGAIRDDHWYGNVSSAGPITAAERTHISENPYLTFEDKTSVYSALNDNLWNRIKYWGQSKTTEPVEKILHTGSIHYPNIPQSKLETFHLIQQSHPELYQKIMTLRSEKGSDITSTNTPELRTLEGQLTEALTQNRIAAFNASAAAMGIVKVGVNDKQYINLVADFQRDLVSIHPMKNGNGRTTRLLMNHLLSRANLPPARVLDPSMDIQKSKTEWQDIVYQGVSNSAKLYADFKERIQNGLALDQSPELLFPGLAEKVEISFKKQGSDKVYLGSNPVKVNSEQFTAFLKEIIKANPEIAEQLKNERVKSMNKIADMFIDFYKSKTIEYMHEKDGRSVIKLRFIESDFIDTFGVVRSLHKHLWKYKMDRWYDQDMLVWRGLSGKTEVADAEILNYFISPSSRIASNAVVGKLRDEKNIIPLMKEDFNKYNQELLNGQLIEMALDHHKEGPRYGTSYGFSTSKREVVGKAFAMGAMVIAEYGKQNDPELQKQLKSRINIASYRADKDVDLGRLKAFDSKFSYIYGRQAEVMAIGGTDPDAVMIVQRISSTGDVEKTYYRNPAQPNEIFVINGRYVPEMGALSKDQIISKHYINIDPANKNITVNEKVLPQSENYIKNSEYTPEAKPKAEKGPSLKKTYDQVADWFNNLF